ncbi:MAG: undecaprenyl-diphosphate phosphatase [Planctomycetota bacterium]
MTSLDALWLGIVQGLTEFLPVSSSGHLVLAEHWLGVDADADVSFEVVAHLGTLLAVLIVFRTSLLAMLGATPRLLRPSGWRESYREDEAFRTAVLVVWATLPVVVVGLGFESRIDALFARTAIVPWMLIVTALVVGATAFLPRREGEPGPGNTLLMGLAQAAAIVPGISRSGSTIAAGLASGMARERAGAFSFLMSIPAILGALVLKLDDLAAGSVAAGPAITVFLASFLSGWGALRVLMALVRRGRLWIFAPYLLVVGVIGVLTLG